MDYLVTTNVVNSQPQQLLSLSQLLTNLIIIYFGSKVGAELAFHLKQPPVLGELAAGLVVGVSGFQWINPDQPILKLLAQVGVILLLFETGLESNIQSLIQVGFQAIAVALTGMIVPFIFGYAVMKSMGYPELTSNFAAACMTVTSMGFSAKVLSELGYLNRLEGKIVLAAAILDDILGVVILSVISELGRGISLNYLNLLGIVGTSIGFLVGAIIVGNLLIPLFIRLVRLLHTRNKLLTASLIFCFSLTYLAEQLGSAAIIGAFVAGLVLATTDKRDEVESRLHPVTDFFLPVFFIMVGAEINLALLGNQEALILSVELTLAAVIGKAICGYAAFKTEANKLAVGMGMVARGEVGLVFATIGLGTGVFTRTVHFAVVVMVIFTTFLGPLLLSFILKRQKLSESDS